MNFLDLKLPNHEQLPTFSWITSQSQPGRVVHHPPFPQGQHPPHKWWSWPVYGETASSRRNQMNTLWGESQHQHTLRLRSSSCQHSKGAVPRGERLNGTSGGEYMVHKKLMHTMINIFILPTKSRIRHSPGCSRWQTEPPPCNYHLVDPWWFSLSRHETQNRCQFGVLDGGMYISR